MKNHSSSFAIHKKEKETKNKEMKYLKWLWKQVKLHFMSENELMNIFVTQQL